MLTNIPINNLAYFTLRTLVSSSETNALGKDNDRLEKLAQHLRSSSLRHSEPSKILDGAIDGSAELFASRSDDVKRKYQNFIDYLKLNFHDPARIQILLFILEKIMPALNNAVEEIPTHEAMKLAQKEATEILSRDGDSALEHIINDWDFVTIKACLSKENDIASTLKKKIEGDLSTATKLASSLKDHIIVSTLQEFERRAGQKRKSRSGDDLHQAVATILQYLKINHDPVPSHISGVIEADLSITYKGMHTLISCKRTGRERVKQATTDIAELQRMRVRKMVWFFTHFDQSDNRVGDMGSRGNLFYLPDSSESYKKLSSNKNLAQYVLPISQIRTTLPQIVRGEI
ncbi:MAG: hypothetical protein HWD92_13450 [Flavobacteriia bacterium]|nr:hypothetical protein [Flavobacteriia bacterium]